MMTDERPPLVDPLTQQPMQDDGGMLLPHYQTFAAVFSAMTKVYPYRYDEALKHSEENARAMRRDVFIMGALEERYREVSQLPWHIEPEDEEDGEQLEAVARLTKIVQRVPRWHQFVWSLEEAVWYGRYGVQMAVGPVEIGGAAAQAVTRHVPTNGDKIQYGYDGIPRVMIYSPAIADLEARGATISYAERAPCIVLDKPQWRDRWAIHNHIADDADYFDGEMSGSVNGVGVRSRIYWAWWLRDEMLGWAVNYMRKVGTLGLMVFPFEDGNPDSKLKAEANARNAGNRSALTVPVKQGSDPKAMSPFLLSANTSGIEALKSMIEEYWERHIERYIIGQTLSSKAGSTGLGSGVSDSHDSTKYRIIRGDAEALAETITRDLLKPLLRWNMPGFKAHLIFKFDVPDPQAKERLEAIKTVVDIGVKVKADDARDAAGLGKPAEDDETVGGQQPGMGPDGKPLPPVAGAGGPAQGPPQADPMGEMYEWSEERGPRGGTRYRDTETGEIDYRERRGRKGGPAHAPSGGKRSAVAPPGEASHGAKGMGILADEGRKLLGHAVGTANQVAAAAKIVGEKAFDKLSPRMQRYAQNLYAAGKWVEHKAMTGYTRGRQLAIETAKESGRGEGHVDAVAKVIGIVDLTLGWTVAFPAVVALTGSIGAGKAASFLPLASLAYLVGSTAINPLATVKAAKKLVAGKLATGGAQHYAADGADTFPDDATGPLLERFERHAGDDWYAALLYAAIDETGGDIAEAMGLADVAYEREPEEPEEGDEDEPDAGEGMVGYAGEFREDDHPRAEDGKFGSGGGSGSSGKTEVKAKGKAKAPGHHPGAKRGSAVVVTAAQKRAWTGPAVDTKTKLTKQETGRVGEAVVLSWLKSRGFADAKPMNSTDTSFPIDLIEDHRPTEVKAGLASNVRKAQQWRLTFSKDSAVEKEAYSLMSGDERAEWNAEKQSQIRERKEAVVAAMQKKYKKTVKPRTVATVINPDTNTADVFVFDGFHDRIDWQSPAAKKAYVGSVKYAHPE